MHVPRRALVPLLSLALTACVFNVVRKEMEEVSVAPSEVESPIRVFMADGSVVVFPDGAVIDAFTVRGREAGQRYDLTRTLVGAAPSVLLDSVVGIEAFDRTSDPALSLVATVGATALLIGGGVLLACAADPKCFGSCPTVYSYDARGEVLEAEAFSFSISPLLEGRDVDRLSATADPDGRVVLEIRNEALETHFINHLELLEVRHAADERVLPDVANETLVVGPLEPVGDVRDRDGRDVTPSLRDRDGDAFGSSGHRVAGVTSEDARDWLALTLPAAPTDSVALVLKLRNSLLSTILFYEFMLGRQGAAALDWMARDVEQIGNAVELGRWFYRTMGLRLEVEGPRGFEEVGRLADTGPIAWKEVAFVVPVRPGEPTRLRLSFLTDQWRVDHLAWSPRVVRPELRVHRPDAARPLAGVGDEEALSRVLEPDEDYLVTSAGTAFELTFETGPIHDDVARTFLLSSQGYYTEWVRPDWIRSVAVPEPFRPDDALVPELMARWQEVKDPMEDAFHETRIPVR